MSPTRSICRRQFLRSSAAFVGANVLPARPREPATPAGDTKATAHPKSLSLDGEWSYRPLARTVMHGDGSISEDHSNLPPAGIVNVPSNWHLTGLPNFNGRVLFTRDFLLSDKLAPTERVFLVFRGVDYFADVNLNGSAVGRHEGYFQSFEFDATTYVKRGLNHLSVIVDAPLEDVGAVWPNHKRMIKGVFSHWDCKPGSVSKEFGQEGTTAGIWNSAKLEIRGRAWFGKVKIQPFLYESKFAIDQGRREGFDAKVLISADVHTTQPGRYLLTVEAGDSKVSVPVKISEPSSSELLVLPMKDPHLWWTWDLGEPYLYDCRLTLSQGDEVIESKTFPFGVRSIAFDEKSGEWRLNGVRFFIRGTNIVPDLWLAHYTPERIAQDTELLRKGHINGVRVCVHVNRQELYDALDRAGIVAWQDFPLQWDYVHSDAFLEEAARQLRDMIRQFFNHPSIITWVCQNESTAYNVNVMDPFLAQVGAEEDSSRPVRPVSAFSEHLYFGWYRGNYREYAALPGSPTISEFGAQALPSLEEVRQMVGDAWPPDWKKLAFHDFQFDQTFHVAEISMGGSWEEFVENSQRYQARLLKFAIEHYRRAKYRKTGSLFQFMFMDCWPAITWSVLSYNRKPKVGYDVLKTCYQPILIGADLDRSIWSKAKKGTTHSGALQPEIVRPWAVNDEHRELEGLSYSALLRGPRGEVEVGSVSGPFTVSADSVSDLPALPCHLPEDVTPGEYELIVRLKDKGGVLSENSYELAVVD